jgi:hypothetical protein
VEDLKSDRFHMFITDTFAVWMVARFALTYVSGLGQGWGKHLKAQAAALCVGRLWLDLI